MNRSHVVEIDGVFLGAAVALPHAEGFRFVAAHAKVEELDGSVWPTLEEARQLAAKLYHTGKLPAGRSRWAIFAQA